MTRLAANRQTIADESYPSHDYTMNRMQLVQFLEQETVVAFHWAGGSALCFATDTKYVAYNVVLHLQQVLPNAECS